MSEELIKIAERIYSTDPSRPRYVMFYEGQLVKRSVLEQLGIVEKPATKVRAKKDVEDKAVKPSSKS